MEQDLSGRTCVVTGGTGALGSAVVARLHGAGARVLVSCFDVEELARFELRDADGVTTVEGVDLCDAKAVEAFYAQAGSLWASIHIAGGFAYTPLEGLTAGDLEAQWRMNTLTATLCAQAARRRMTGGGRMVNVTARPALDGSQGAALAAYATSKAAVANLTELLAAELLEEGILVNAVAPSVIDTAANRASMPDADHARWVAPGDLAEVIAFLVSPANRILSGALLPCYGRA